MTAPHPQSASQILAQAFLTLAREQLANYDFDQAAALLERAWRTLANPKDASVATQVLRTQVLFTQGMVALNGAKWQLALVTLRQALLRAHRSHAPEDPERLEIHNVLALAARRVGKFTVAAEHLHLALGHAVGEQKLRIHRNIAMLELDRNRPEFAEPHARKAMELDGGEEQQFLLGRCLLALHQPEEAMKLLSLAATSKNHFLRHQSRSLLAMLGG